MALKVITPSSNTGFDDVGTQDYRSGQIGGRNSSGAIVLSDGHDNSAGDGTGIPPIGVLGEDKITTTLQQTTQVSEEVTLTSGVAVALSHDAIVTNSQRVVVKATGSALTETTDYTFVDASGTISSTGTQANGTVVLVTYTFQLNDANEKDFRGVNYKGSLDDTEGSGKATVWKGNGEFETDQFVTDVAYSINDVLRVSGPSHDMGAGLLTNEVASGNPPSVVVGNLIVGRVTKIPTAADPLLGFEFIPTANT